MNLCGWNFSVKTSHSDRASTLSTKISPLHTLSKGCPPSEEAHFETCRVNHTWTARAELQNTIKRKPSFIDGLNMKKEDADVARFYVSEDRNAEPAPGLRTPTSTQPCQQFIAASGQTAAQREYELMRENLRLRRIVEKQYQPLKARYEQLKVQQEERDFLISQLEWKVRELARDLKDKRRGA